ncbi:MAG: hypothetical protein HC835_18015 [Oscillatoriales cyanobacterium RM2_1_1]|nr:hypothetical protein [Oscillatoriales cyanobacterium SM2_3_0]NJO47352.1 hypothetical protein [Oscillatoriales cyanobacterium RM2_1_1]
MDNEGKGNARKIRENSKEAETNNNRSRACKGSREADQRDQPERKALPADELLAIRQQFIGGSRRRRRWKKVSGESTREILGWINAIADAHLESIDLSDQRARQQLEENAQRRQKFTKFLNEVKDEILKLETSTKKDAKEERHNPHNLSVVRPSQELEEQK